MGSVIAWCQSYYGQCDVPPPNQHFTAVAAGADHSIGLKSDGSIVAWGMNTHHECDVPEPNTDFKAIGAGRYFSMGIKSNGSIVAWGNNQYGQCDVPSPNTGFIAVTGGDQHSLGLKSDGSVVVFGSDYWGVKDIPTPNSGFVDIAMGFVHCLGLRSDGSIVTWGGNNGNGELDVPSPNEGFIAVGAGSQHSLGVKSNGSVVAWGSNNKGQCDVPDPNSGFVKVSGGYEHSIGLKSGGFTAAWGENVNGQSNDPVPNSALLAVAAGGWHNLALKADPPSMATGPATLIESSSATLNGQVTDAMGDDVSRGFSWRELKYPPGPWTEWTDSGPHREGAYSHPVSSLRPDTDYEYRAWAQNGGGRTDGNVVVFKSEAETPTAQDTWFIAEGSTNWGFETYISVVNPNSAAVTVDLTYMPTDGANKTQAVTLPAGSQATVYPRELLGAEDFSTRVVCRGSKTIAVDRTMEWRGQGAPAAERHTSVGVTAPSRTWYLPEGSTNWGFETWLLVQNPNDARAKCAVTYMVEGEGPKTVNHEVPANSRATFSMSEDIGNKDASIEVTSDRPVISERAMYRNNRREGHESIGATTPSSDCYLAEGTTDWGFTTYLLLQNPDVTENKVNITYMTPQGAVPHPQNPVSMPPHSRKTIRVNDFLPAKDFSTRVSGEKPLIAERAMYWDSGTGEACHDSIGMSSPHMIFYLPDGQAGSDVETWTLVQNPNGVPVEVTVFYLTSDGKGDIGRDETIPANSRRTFNMAEHSQLSGRASIIVAVKPGARPVMVERAMYWNARAAGAGTIGGSGD